MKTSAITYLGQLRTEATHLRSAKSLITDAPVDNNGKGEAFSPTDLAATSLGSCAMTIVGIAAEKAGHDFKHSEVSITKIMTDEAPRKIKKIQVEFTFRCEPALSETEKNRYQRLAQTCPVALSLHPDIEQSMTFIWQK
jgi:putative redox protein